MYLYITAINHVKIVVYKKYWNHLIENIHSKHYFNAYHYNIKALRRTKYVVLNISSQIFLFHTIESWPATFMIWKCIFEKYFHRDKLSFYKAILLNVLICPWHWLTTLRPSILYLPFDCIWYYCNILTFARSFFFYCMFKNSMID